MKLENKSALITGAASGIGNRIARLFACEGAKVAIADLDKDAAGSAAAEIRGSGAQAIAIAMDVTDEKAVNDGVASIVAGISEQCADRSVARRQSRVVHAVKLDIAPGTLQPARVAA